MDSYYLQPGMEYRDLPETYIIFITEHDVLKRGLPVYRIERQILQTGQPFEDGGHIVYVNGSYRDAPGSASPIGRLMADFRASDPNRMHYETLAKKVRMYKEQEQGGNEMCRIFEELREEAREEGWEEGRAEGQSAVVRKLLNCMTVEQVAQLLEMSLEEIQAIKDEEANGTGKSGTNTL